MAFTSSFNNTQKMKIMTATDATVNASTTIWTTSVTTPGPAESTDSVVIAVVIILVLCTVAGLAFVLYRYLCHSKGVYRTTGEPAPGLDPDQVYQDTVTENKKEYFI